MQDIDGSPLTAANGSKQAFHNADNMVKNITKIRLYARQVTNVLNDTEINVKTETLYHRNKRRGSLHQFQGGAMNAAHVSASLLYKEKLCPNAPFVNSYISSHCAIQRKDAVLTKLTQTVGFDPILNHVILWFMCNYQQRKQCRDKELEITASGHNGCLWRFANNSGS